MKNSKHSRKKRARIKEFDFAHSFPNKYAARYARGTNVVLLAPDVAKLFPNSEAVNNVLRAIASAFPKQRKRVAASGIS
ncbi:MAG: hypothetical protein AAB209_03190 [Bacteroidota bacterium]